MFETFRRRSARRFSPGRNAITTENAPGGDAAKCAKSPAANYWLPVRITSDTNRKMLPLRSGKIKACTRNYFILISLDVFSKIRTRSPIDNRIYCPP